MNEPKIPVFLAVGLWAASALAVLTYTAIAFKETAGGAESGAMGIVAGPAGLLVADAGILAAEQSGIAKPLNRGKFKPSH